MTPDDESEPKVHTIDVPKARHRRRLTRRRSYQILAAAAGLAVAGIVVGVVMVQHQRSSDEHLTTDALQREDLRDGWKALGAAAALDAQGSAVPAPVAPAANVVIVNVPGQAGPPGAPGMPGAPGQAGQVVYGASGVPAVGTSGISSANNGVSSVPVVVPNSGYGLGNAPLSQGGTSDLAPANAVGQNTEGAFRGSNAAFPNTSNPGAAPGLRDSVGNISNPTSNVPSGSSNLPTGSPSLPSGVP